MVSIFWLGALPQKMHTQYLRQSSRRSRDAFVQNSFMFAPVVVSHPEAPLGQSRLSFWVWMVSWLSSKAQCVDDLRGVSPALVPCARHHGASAGPARCGEDKWRVALTFPSAAFSLD